MLFPLSRVISTICFFVIYFFFRAYAILFRRSTSICMVWALVKGNWLVHGGYTALIGFSGMSMTTAQHERNGKSGRASLKGVPKGNA